MRGPQAQMGARFNIQYNRAFGVQRAVTGGIGQYGPAATGPFPGRTPVAQYGVPRIRPSGAIPTLSNFDTGGAFDAWFFYREGDVHQVCAMQGASFLLRARRAMGLNAGVWDAPFQQAIIDRIASLPNQETWVSVLAALRSDLAGQRASRLSHRIALWLTYEQPFNRRLDAVTIPDNAQLIMWGESPDRGDGLMHDLLCFDAEIESLPTTAAAQATAIAESTTGIRVGAGRAAPPSGGAAPVPVGEGITGWRIGAVAVGIIGLLWVVTSD